MLPLAPQVANDYARLPKEDNTRLFELADAARRKAFGDTIRLCMICSARSGLCGEDCAFCAQRRGSKAQIEIYGLKSALWMQERGEDAARAGAHRFSIVTSGRHTGKTETTTIATAVENMSKLPVQRCASLGVLDVGALQSLKRRGLQTYHHNLEAARSFYGSIVGTRTYDDNLATINAARDAGLRICSGGIFGMGESWEQRIELLTEMARLDVDGVPINFLVPIPGTPLSDQPLLPPWEALRIIALARLMMPAVDIIIAGGREPVLGDQQHQIFRAGASSMMVGNYLTTSGRCLEDDLEMIAACGLRLEGKL